MGMSQIRRSGRGKILSSMRKLGTQWRRNGKYFRFASTTEICNEDREEEGDMLEPLMGYKQYNN